MYRISFLPRNSASERGWPSSTAGKTRSGNGFPISSSVEAMAAGRIEASNSVVVKNADARVIGLT